MKKTFLFLLLAVAGSYGAAYGQNQNNKVVVSDKTGWHKIGETYVDFKRDRDEINVLGADRFASLQFAVTEAPVHVMKLEVQYEDGSMKEVPVDMILEPGAESKIIDLKGAESNVKKVIFVYHTVGGRHDEKAHVELWGMKTNPDKKE
jgi:hypothetical protein